MFDIPYLHIKNFAPDLVESLNEDISKEYDRRIALPNTSNMYRKLSVYDENGVHTARTGKSHLNFENITNAPELENRIRLEAINYMKQLCGMTPIQEQLLASSWANYGWWSCFHNSDSYEYHAHSQFQLVATYYVHNEAEHCPISFKNPMGVLLEGWCPGVPTKEFAEAIETVIEPQTGDLMIWLPFLEHYVMNKQAYDAWRGTTKNAENTDRLSQQSAVTESNHEDFINSIDCRKSITIGYQKISQQNLRYLQKQEN